MQPVIVLLVSHKLVFVHVSVADPEDNRLDGKRHGRRTPNPNQIRVLDHRGQNLAQGTGERRGEQEQRHHQRPHVLRGTGVGQFVRGHVAETFRDGSQRDGGHLDPDRQGRNASANITGRGVEAAGAGLIHPPLHDRRDDAGNHGNDESTGDAADATKSDLVLAQQGVDDVAEKRDGDDDGQWVEVAEQVIWRSLGRHGGTLVRLDTANAAIVQVVDGEVEEDLAGVNRATDVIDELVVPVDFLAAPGRDALRRHHTGFGGIPDVLAPELPATALEDHDHHLGEFAND